MSSVYLKALTDGPRPLLPAAFAEETKVEGVAIKALAGSKRSALRKEGSHAPKSARFTDIPSVRSFRKEAVIDPSAQESRFDDEEPLPEELPVDFAPARRAIVVTKLADLQREFLDKGEPINPSYFYEALSNEFISFCEDRILQNALVEITDHEHYNALIYATRELLIAMARKENFGLNQIFDKAFYRLKPVSDASCFETSLYEEIYAAVENEKASGKFELNEAIQSELFNDFIQKLLFANPAAQKILRAFHAQIHS